jgi:hypothetical protein
LPFELLTLYSSVMMKIASFPAPREDFDFRQGRQQIPDPEEKDARDLTADEDYQLIVQEVLGGPPDDASALEKSLAERIAYSSLIQDSLDQEFHKCVNAAERGVNLKVLDALLRLREREQRIMARLLINFGLVQGLGARKAINLSVQRAPGTRDRRRR